MTAIIFGGGLFLLLSQKAQQPGYRNIETEYDENGNGSRFLLRKMIDSKTTNGVLDREGDDVLVESKPLHHHHDGNGFLLPPTSLYRVSVEDAHGQLVSLAKYAGMVTLVVNVACM